LGHRIVFFALDFQMQKHVLIVHEHMHHHIGGQGPIFEFGGQVGFEDAAM
jgi:hypothetical protein